MAKYLTQDQVNANTTPYTLTVEPPYVKVRYRTYDTTWLRFRGNHPSVNPITLYAGDEFEFPVDETTELEFWSNSTGASYADVTYYREVL